MSFLLVEDEAQATLAEALAFIDTFAAGGEEAELGESSSSRAYTSSSSPSSSTESSGSPPLLVTLRIPRSTDGIATSLRFDSVDSASASATSADGAATGSSSDDETAPVSKKQKQAAKSRAANTRAVNRYRKRSKNEIMELHNKVAQLTSQLAGLHRRESDAIVERDRRSRPSHMLQRLKKTTNSSTMGFEDVLLEYRRQQESEALNRRLKDAVAKHRSMSATLESVFQKQLSKNNLSFVWNVESRLQKNAKTSETPVVHQPCARVYSELFHYLKQVVFDNTPAVLRQFQHCDLDCVFSSAMTKQDRQVGRMLELTYNVPLVCSLEQLDTVLWANLAHPNDSMNVAEMIAKAGADPEHGCERPFTSLFSGNFGDVHINGVTAIHRFVEPHRIVLAYTSLFVPLGSDLQIRENGWLIMSDSTASGCATTPTLLQTVYRIHSERQNTTPMSPEMTVLRDFVMAAQGERMRRCHESIQNLLQHQLQWVAEAESLPMCMQTIPYIRT